jgi:lipoate-protein ligase A
MRAAGRLLERATTVEAALGHTVTWDEAARAFIQAFETVFELDFQPGELSAAEKIRAEELASLKYSHPELDKIK